MGSQSKAKTGSKVTAGKIISLVSVIAGVIAVIAGLATGSAGSGVTIPLVIAIVCDMIYLVIAGKVTDILNLVSVILIAVALSQYIIGSIATFADALNGITMFGSGGGIQAVITVIVFLAIALLSGIVSCFVKR